MGKRDAIVVGAGIAGTMTALSLARAGIKTTLIDRWEPGHSRASSTDYNRVIRSIHGRDEFYTRWARESRERWLEMQAETGQRLYYECGALVLATAGGGRFLRVVTGGPGARGSGRNGQQPA